MAEKVKYIFHVKSWWPSEGIDIFPKSLFFHKVPYEELTRKDWDELMDEIRNPTRIGHIDL